jgi:hypothetical protein
MYPNKTFTYFSSSEMTLYTCLVAGSTTLAKEKIGNEHTKNATRN